MVSPPVMSTASKRHRGDGDQPTEEHMETEAAVTGKSAPAKSGQQGAAASSQRRGEDKAEERNDECSVFISNLSYTLQEPEAKLRGLFEACGPLQNIRPVFSNKGSFKGYCYVQFESAASVPAALRLDRTQVEGRPMFVSPCVDKNRNPNFKVYFVSVIFVKVSTVCQKCLNVEINSIKVSAGEVTVADSDLTPLTLINFNDIQPAHQDC